LIILSLLIVIVVPGVLVVISRKLSPLVSRKDTYVPVVQGRAKDPGTDRMMRRQRIYMQQSIDSLTPGGSVGNDGAQPKK
jgi:hypothetical protein